MKQRTTMRMEARASQRMAIMGRLRMADWIEMPESEFAREIEKIEKDSLFRKLFSGAGQAQGIIQRQRWPSSRMSGSFYEINEQILAKGESVQVEKSLSRRAELLPIIQSMGQEAFERYFLYGEEALTLDQIAQRTGLKVEQVHAIHDLLLEIGAQAEFFLPERDASLAKSYFCLARLAIESGEPVFEFYSPHWARGLYHVRYELLEQWKAKGLFKPDERRKLPRLLKRIETINLRQNTVFRILESLTKLQARYLSSRQADRKLPISLRQLARRLDLAASTVSRALSNRSVKLPWGKEAPLSEFVPGRRNVVREILSRWLKSEIAASDSRFAERLKQEYGIRIARRTVNAVRNELLRSRGVSRGYRAK